MAQHVASITVARPLNKRPMCRELNTPSGVALRTSNDKSNIVCWNCNQKGHYANDANCPAGQKASFCRMDAKPTEDLDNSATPPQDEGALPEEDEQHKLNAMHYENDSPDGLVGEQYESRSEAGPEEYEEYFEFGEA